MKRINEYSSWIVGRRQSSKPPKAAAFSAAGWAWACTQVSLSVVVIAPSPLVSGERCQVSPVTRSLTVLPLGLIDFAAIDHGSLDARGFPGCRAGPGAAGCGQRRVVLVAVAVAVVVDANADGVRPLGA